MLFPTWCERHRFEIARCCDKISGGFQDFANIARKFPATRRRKAIGGRGGIRTDLKTTNWGFWELAR
jgi:hypothetical protein